jgi:serine/threonine protein kinase
VGDGRDGSDPSGDDSWTDMEDVRPDRVEAIPIRHGMVLGGRYTIEKVIGRGGMGVVVRAHDRHLKEAVAIKIVRAELSGEEVWAARMAREVKLARQIHHPHVCRVFDFQQADGRVFLVMELATKGTVRVEIRSGVLKARPLAERIADARAVASALAAIHQAGIVHRDLTPQNLLRMGDGRVVLSDFGLAMETQESSTSVRGGTVAYMAPELWRGGPSSFASDVWALGVVMHEMVFGEKPRWSDATSSKMLPPDLGRPLTDQEEIVFQACRACASKDPEARPCPIKAGTWLTERGGSVRRRSRFGVNRRAAGVAGVAMAIAAVATALVVSKARLSSPPSAAAAETAWKASPLIAPSGTPADWTETSAVLAEVPERIHCTRLLPDRRTVRFVWGAAELHAEDIDTVTRARAPSPVVPAAYAEGCPDLSSDGKRLVYQGHAPDGRPFAFLSASPDGHDAAPVVQTAEPSMGSDPTWLADSQTFSYDVDAKHMGVFSTAGGRINVLPDVTTRSFVTFFRFAIGHSVYIGTYFDSAETEIVGISLPLIREEQRFRIPKLALDLRMEGQRLYFAHRNMGHGATIVALDVASRAARAIGEIPEHLLRYPMLAETGMVFASIRLTSDLVLQKPNGTQVNLTNGAHVWDANHCGPNLIVSNELAPERVVVERWDLSGKRIERLSDGPTDWGSACSADGNVWFYIPHTPHPGIRRCDRRGCREIYKGFAIGLSASPDGKRLVFLTMDTRGSVVRWIGTDGGETHEVADSETTCPAGWATAQTVWVSRRREGKLLWTEVDADSGKETGKTVPGTRDCSDARPDPASPVSPDLRIVYDQTSQIRLLGKDHLARH